MNQVLRQHRHHLVDRACYAILKLTQYSNLLIHPSNTNSNYCTYSTFQKKIDTINVKLWNAKFSLFITQYILKKELRALISILLNINTFSEVIYSPAKNNDHTLLSLTHWRTEPKKSNAP